MLFSERSITNWMRALLGGLFLSLTALHAQQQNSPSHVETLEGLSSSVQNVVARVAPAIVRVEVVGYSRANDDGDEESATHLVTKKDSIASGIILDSDGYIVTNAHVVEGARRVRVILAPGTEFDADIVGAFAEADLALLKIAATGLPVLPLADSRTIQPGQLVFAVGNPEGLNNSVSMGVVSAVARQREADLSPAYIQTDAAISPGSSGGALVDIHGSLIGMTSFIVTEGGGNEGLGFALPSGLVHLICEALKAKGHFEVGDIGLRVQTITPRMSSGLHLAKNSGLIVSDVIPGSSAEAAGIRVQDILLGLDGIPMDTPAQYATSFYTRRVGDRVKLKLLRSTHSFTAEVIVHSGGDEPEDLLDRIDMQKNMVKQLDIVAATLNEKTRPAASGLRSNVGVLVAGRVTHSDVQTGLASGDLIRSVNGTNVQTVEALRSLLQKYKSGEPIVLQIERHGRFRYLSFESD